MPGPYKCDNVDRADFAWPAIDAFQKRTRHNADDWLTADEFDQECAQTEIIGDLVGDLMHFVTLHGGDPVEVVAAGMGHFKEEAGLGYGEDDDED